MDYEETIEEMLQDMANDFTVAKYNKAIRSMGVGLARALAMMANKEAIDPAVEAMTHAIRVTAHDHWKEIHSDEVGADEYLQHHFKPTKTND